MTEQPNEVPQMATTPFRADIPAWGFQDGFAAFPPEPPEPPEPTKPTPSRRKRAVKPDPRVTVLTPRQSKPDPRRTHGG